jgi:AcrR family transcriptional regulator
VADGSISFRDAAKEVTRKRIVAAARKLFTTHTYESTGIRDIAAEAGYSTGAVFNCFANKEQVWREAMGTEPPVDSPLTRAAPAMLDFIRNACPVLPEPLRVQAQEVMAEAEKGAAHG